MIQHYVPFCVKGKRGLYSENYLEEFITPLNLAVEREAAKISKLFGDELIISAFNIIAPFRYIWDDRIWGYDRWNLPHETLNMQAGDCEDTSYCLTSLLIAAGLSRDRLRCLLGTIIIKKKAYGHAWVEVLRQGQWYLLESTLDQWKGWLLVPSNYKRALAFTDESWESFLRMGKCRTKEIIRKKPHAEPIQIGEMIGRICG